MLFVTAVFGGLMLLSAESRRRVITMLLIGAITILGTSPAPAQAPPFCLPCVIQAVLATISVTIGGWLNQINSVLGRFSGSSNRRLAARQDQPGEVANPIDHHAVPWSASIDHVDQPSHRDVASPSST